MKNSFFISILIASILLLSCTTKQPDKEELKLVKQEQSLADNIGEKFTIGELKGISGNTVKLDFSNSDTTIIDFWFNGCPPCIEEMKQFASLLTNTKANVSIISISINRHSLWQKTITSPAGRFAFLSQTSSNWKHYNLATSESEQLKNDLPADNQQQLIDRYNVTFFPAYFVVNNKGIILERPISAVDYIKAL